MPSDKQKAKPEKRRKRTWQPPTVKTGSLFETNSLACGKEQINDDCQRMGDIKAS